MSQGTPQTCLWQRGGRVVLLFTVLLTVFHAGELSVGAAEQTQAAWRWEREAEMWSATERRWDLGSSSSKGKRSGWVDSMRLGDRTGDASPAERISWVWDGRAALQFPPLTDSDRALFVRWTHRFSLTYITHGNVTDTHTAPTAFLSHSIGCRDAHSSPVDLSLCIKVKYKGELVHLF